MWDEMKIDEKRDKKGADDIGFIHQVKSLDCIFTVTEAMGGFCSGDWHDIIDTIKILLWLVVW